MKRGLTDRWTSVQLDKEPGGRWAGRPSDTHTDRKMGQRDKSKKDGERREKKHK